MKTKKEELTQERLKELLHYDPETGVFTWKERPLSMFKTISRGKTWNKRYSEKKAGAKYESGNLIGILNKNYQSRRLAWLYTYGEWPKNQIDNIDGDLCNDKINNLRNANIADGNNKSIKKNNKTGFPGVRKYGTGFSAQIYIKGKKYLSRLIQNPGRSSRCLRRSEKACFA